MVLPVPFSFWVGHYLPAENDSPHSFAVTTIATASYCGYISCLLLTYITYHSIMLVLVTCRVRSLVHRAIVFASAASEFRNFRAPCAAHLHSFGDRARPTFVNTVFTNGASELCNFHVPSAPHTGIKLLRHCARPVLHFDSVWRFPQKTFDTC